MKNITKLLLLTIISFVFVGMVNAAEVDLIQNVANISKDVSATTASIVPKTTGYKYYYRIVKINDADFGNYVKQKYIVENSQEGTTAYVNAMKEKTTLENKFKTELIPTINNASDLTSGSWKEAKNNIINPTDFSIVNASGVHNGYVLAVAATKSGDNNIYITRLIKESTSATTLSDVTNYFDGDKTTINNTTTETTTAVETTTTTETKTEENPETAVSDWAIFITPISIAIGSGILLRRKSYA